MKSMLAQLRKLNCVHYTESCLTSSEHFGGIIKSENQSLIEMHLKRITLTNAIALRR